ncbi:hypothetical protein [Sphaerisporangium aureirubrum]|uniref:Uncharacterized protein n=1 Tax=Sphaerisporangium aureirubrum TaxID=1544736 RepID=A0ABW1NB71_9ACTN
MPCYRCGIRQTDPIRGASPWRRAVHHDSQVLICPNCQREHDLDLDRCANCNSTTLICRLGEIECRTCGTTRSATPPPPTDPTPPGLSEEVAAALTRVLGTHPTP